MFSVEAEVGYPLLLQEDTAIVGRRVGAEAAIAYILGNLAVVDRAQGAFDRADELIEESLARFQALADVQGEAFALGALGNLARSSGDFERGRALLERSLALRQEIGDRRGTGITLGCLAVLLARSGDEAGARAAAEQSRDWFAENDDMIGLSAAELSLANVASGRRRWRGGACASAGRSLGVRGYRVHPPGGLGTGRARRDVRRGRRTGDGAPLARPGDPAVRVARRRRRHRLLP